MAKPLRAKGRGALARPHRLARQPIDEAVRRISLKEDRRSMSINC